MTTKVFHNFILKSVKFAFYLYFILSVTMLFICYFVLLGGEILTRLPGWTSMVPLLGLLTCCYHQLWKHCFYPPNDRTDLGKHFNILIRTDYRVLVENLSTRVSWQVSHLFVTISQWKRPPISPFWCFKSVQLCNL